MVDLQITFSGKAVYVGGQRMEVEYPVRDAFLASDKVIVLYDPDSYTERFGQFQNLVAFTPDGKKVWTAELPTTTSGDRYYRIVLRGQLIASSIYSYECEIDCATGKITAKLFLK